MSDDIRPEAARFYHNDASGSHDNQDDDGFQSGFSHLDEAGSVNMVDIGAKKIVKRTAVAEGRISVGQNVLEFVLKNKSISKGDIMTVSKVAGINGAKSTSQLIPLCHQIPLNHIKVDIEPCQQVAGSILVTATVEAHYNTGVEMESLTAVAVTLLTLYDMCKSMNKSMVVSGVRLVTKKKE